MSRIDTANPSPAAPLPVAPDAGHGAYRIQRGDTLGEIARQHGTSIEALMAANPQIRDPDLILAGDSLRLPGDAAPGAGGGNQHIVQPGETLSQLSRHAGTDVGTLARLNHLSNPDLIRVGQVLELPGRGAGASAGAGGGASAGAGASPGSPSAPGGATSWMAIARGETGQHEVAGSRHNGRILEYHGTTTLGARSDETPWCSSFVNWTMERAGHQGTDSAAAISWKNWGDKVDGLANGREGDIVVIRNKSTGQNHVGFLFDSGNGRVNLLGGNQSDQVKETSFNLSRYEVVAVRRPPGADAGAGTSPASAPASAPTAASAPAAAPQRGISEADYAAVASQLGVDVAAIKAVAEVESAGGGMLASGKPKILFEAHVFHRETGGRHDDTHPNLSSERWDRSLYGKGGEHQWDRFDQAAVLDPQAAMKSASWGRFQIMGFNHQRAGFDNVQSFVDAMKRGEGEQLKAFANFIQSDPKMLQALRNHDWAGFAERYNGASYAQNQYDSKIAEAYRRFAH